MYQLPDSITIFNSEEVLESLNKYLQSYLESGQSGTVTIDAKQLTDIDGAGLQLLLSAYKTCEQKNIPFKLLGVNQEIVGLLDITGTKDVLEREEA